ncbi:MAG: type II toxin-antitoxin system VapC family toxin [Planctomycetes bacterium]|nr:type II toxin-antitoxin system VapC family toxin [Planctomycetota bacterium]
MIVLDASVLTKLFLCEVLSDAAEAVVAQHSLVFAPEFARVEVASAITRVCRQKAFDAVAASEGLNRWRRFTTLDTVRFATDVSLLPEAESLSLSLRHPLADCLYLALAKRERLPLITADRPFVDAVGTEFPNVCHLAEYEGLA